jgi:hypothetical protein
MEILVENFFSDEVVIHFNVFGPNIGLEERESSNIINPQAWSVEKRNP